LVNVIAAKVGSIRVVGQEVSQEGGKVVAMPQHQVGTQHMLVHEAQVEVIAEGVYMHQVPHFVTLLCEQHGQLRVDSLPHWDSRTFQCKLFDTEVAALESQLHEDDASGQCPLQVVCSN
jgi:hypothetical protein